MKFNYLILCLMFFTFTTIGQGTLEYRKGGLLYWKMDGPFMSSHNSGNSILMGIDAGINSNFSFSLKNTFIGQSAGSSLTDGNNNIGIGFNAFLNATGSRNVAIGNNSLTMGTPLYNVAIGDSAAYSNTQFGNVIIGKSAAKNNSTGSNNVIIGYEAGKNVGSTDADNNIFIGHQAGYHESGDHKLYIDNTSTSTPLIYGDFTLDELRVNGRLKVKNEYGFPLFDGSADQVMKTDGSGQLDWVSISSIGVSNIDDLSDGKTSTSNVYLGSQAGNLDNGDYKNTGIGKESLKSNVAGTNNVAIGHEAMESFNNGSNNTAIGFRALWGDISNSHNVAVGQATLSASGIGNYNTGIGTRAGQNNKGKENTFVGALAGNSATGDGNVMIGAYAGQNESGSNKLYIDNSSTSSPLIYGDFVTDEVRINGSLDIDGDYTLPITSGSTGNIMLNAGPGNTATWSPYFMPTTSGTSGQVLRLGGSGFATWSDDDADPTNEYNLNMSLVANNLTITDAGGNHSVSLAAYENQWSENANNLFYSIGNVGLGTNNVQAQLHINSTVGEVPLRTQIGGSTKFIVNTDGSTSIGAYETNGPDDGLYVEGDVGFGTVNPKGKLHIHDSSSDVEMFLTPTGASNGNSTLFMAEDEDADLGMYWLYSGLDDRLELRGQVSTIQYGPHLLVDRATGDVAIGSLYDDGYRLSVDGKISCEELKVEDSGDWPDFVFRDDYPLKPLSEVKEFIEKNGHLPQIPSADEINGKGIKTGQMIEKLLQKIEELTLYTLKQQEEINELKSIIQPSNSK